MATLSCTFNGYNSYSGTAWYKTSWQTADAYGMLGYGKATSSSNQRAILVKFTTPKLPDNYTNRYLTIKVPLFRYGGSGTDKFYYRITTSGPTLTDNSGAQIPAATDCFSGSQSATTTNSYTTITFTTSSHAFVGNTTYYLWLIANTPVGATGTLSGHYAHSSAQGYISVTMNYTDSATYTKPTVSLSGYKGFYGGATLNVSGTGHIYLATSLNGTYYHKGSGTTCTLDADTTSTSKTVYVFRSDISLGTNTSGGYPPSSTYIRSFSVPRFACRVYCHSTSTKNFTGNSGTFTPTAVDGYSFVGLTASSTATSKTYDPNWDTYGPSINGKTLYAIYNASKTFYFYRAQAISTMSTLGRTLYGKTSDTGWQFKDSVPDQTCGSDSSFTLIGWTGDVNSTSASYTDILSAANDYNTVYGIYEKSNYPAGTKSGPYYRGTSTAFTWSRTGTYDKAYYYGTGQISYGTISYSYSYDDSCAASSNWGNAIGATTSLSSFTNLSSIENLINAVQAGTKIYLVYKRIDSMNFHISNNGGTITSENYLYGIGSTTNNIPLEPEIADYDIDATKLKLSGWANTVGGTPLTWEEQWNNGVRIVYAILVFNNNIYYGADLEKKDKWQSAIVYYGVNGEWKPVLLRFGVNNTWK